MYFLYKKIYFPMTQKKKELPYLERDISWMYFNRRILQEAARPHVPLLERMAFLGIFSKKQSDRLPKILKKKIYT